jgi:PadR family transcriptional regulator PadR
VGHPAVMAPPKSFLPTAGTFLADPAYAPLDGLEESSETSFSGELAVPEKPTELVQGTLEMLVLKTLALEPMHGYGIALRMEQVSDGVFRVNPGSLLPALSRLERADYVKSEWAETENNRRAKYYRLTEKGRKALETEKAEWARQIAAIHRILEA